MKSFFLFAKILLTGGIVLGLELAASRVMTPFFGVSLYVWSAILSVTLIALALGYKFGGVLAGRLGRDRTMLFFASSGALAGLWISLTSWTYPFLFWPLAGINLVAGSILASTFLLFVPLIILSALNPILVALLTHDSGADHGAGHVFFVSTIGSVLGVFAVAYGLLPYITNYQTIVLMALAASLVSLVALFLMRGQGGRFYKGAVTMAAISALIAALTLGTGGLERFTRTFAHDKITWKIVHAAPSYFGHIQIVDLFTADGRQITRALLNDGMTQNQFYPNGASSALFSHALQRIGLSSVENPQKALILGVAAGVIPMAYAKTGIKVRAVDINPKIVNVAQEYFGFDPALVHVEYADARTAVRHCERDNDIVAVDLFRDDGIPEHLVTYEFFSDIKNCMRDNGVMVMNSFLSRDHRDSNYALLKTIAQVFGEVVFIQREPRPGAFLTSGFIVARRNAPVGDIKLSLDSMPVQMANDLRQAAKTIEVLRPGDAKFANVPLLTDLSNQWKRLALPVDIAYRQRIVEQMPWQILLN